MDFDNFNAKLLKMKKIYSFLFICLLGFSAWTQEVYSRVRILCNNQELLEIADLGIAVDHGKRKSDYSLETEISQSEIATLRANGYLVEILIDDVKAHFLAANAASSAKSYERASGCGSGGNSNIFDPVTPANFELGSMGGYLTYQEMLDNLDSMASKYPSLITTRTGIGSFLSHQGREIWWVKISDNPSTDEAEHEVLYTSLHHAREPMCLSQNIFYMWWLLENYGTDDEVTYLVDNTEMYFVPMINPDGYIENETTDPSGGGMHRKNMNPAVGTYNPGVDLNRNYSYHWNATGTSPDPNNDTYAGSNAFSEPETQAIKWFCEQRDFEFAFNTHTYGNLMLFPIGWTTSEYAADNDYFLQYTSHFVQFNGYVNEKSSGLYPAAGDSDDYMYIEDWSVKPKIFPHTPEIGTAFWQPSADIIPTCKGMIWPDKSLAHMPHVYGVLYDMEGSWINEMSGYFNYELERLGLEDGDMTVSITPLSGIQSVGSANVHTLTLGEIVDDSIDYILDPAIAFGDEIKYILKTDNGLWVRNDTVTKTYGTLTAIFSDDCSTMDNWTTDGDWGYTDEDYVSPSNSITDSPYDGSYNNYENSSIVLNEIVDLSSSTFAYVNFYAKCRVYGLNGWRIVMDAIVWSLYQCGNLRSG